MINISLEDMGKKCETVVSVVNPDGVKENWTEVSYMRPFKQYKPRPQAIVDPLTNPQAFDHVVFVRGDSSIPNPNGVVSVNKFDGGKNKKFVPRNLARLDTDDVPDIPFIAKSVSDVLKTARNNANLNQHELAVKTGVLESTIKSLENGTARWTDDKIGRAHV